jgi:hypothetical protein
MSYEISDHCGTVALVKLTGCPALAQAVCAECFVSDAGAILEATASPPPNTPTTPTSSSSNSSNSPRSNGDSYGNGNGNAGHGLPTFYNSRNEDATTSASATAAGASGTTTTTATSELEGVKRVMKPESLLCWLIDLFERQFAASTGCCTARAMELIPDLSPSQPAKLTPGSLWLVLEAICRLVVQCADAAVVGAVVRLTCRLPVMCVRHASELVKAHSHAPASDLAQLWHSHTDVLMACTSGLTALSTVFTQVSGELERMRRAMPETYSTHSAIPIATAAAARRMAMQTSNRSSEQDQAAVATAAAAAVAGGSTSTHHHHHPHHNYNQQQQQLSLRLDNGGPVDLIRRKQKAVAILGAGEWGSFSVLLGFVAIKAVVPTAAEPKQQQHTRCSTPPASTESTESASAGVCTPSSSSSSSPSGASSTTSSNTNNSGRNKRTSHHRSSGGGVSGGFESGDKRMCMIRELSSALASAVEISPRDFHPAVPVLAKMMLRCMPFLHGASGRVHIVDQYESVSMVALLDRVIVLCGNTNGGSAAALVDAVSHITAAFLEQSKVDKKSSSSSSSSSSAGASVGLSSGWSGAAGPAATAAASSPLFGSSVNASSHSTALLRGQQQQHQHVSSRRPSSASAAAGSAGTAGASWSNSPSARSVVETPHKQQRHAPHQQQESVFTRAPGLSTAYFKLCSATARVWCGEGIDVSASLSIDVQQWLPAHRSELTNVVKEALECAVTGLECGIYNREVAKSLLDFINHLVLTSGSEELGATQKARTSLDNPVLTWWAGCFSGLISSGIGQRVVRGLLLACGGKMPPWMIDHVAVTFRALALRFRDKMRQWVVVSLESPCVPRGDVTTDVKGVFTDKLFGLGGAVADPLAHVAEVKKQLKALCAGRPKSAPSRTTTDTTSRV